MGRPTGFEPATSWTTTRCSNLAELRPPWTEEPKQSTHGAAASELIHKRGLYDR